jgi:hypothetical protein
MSGVDAQFAITGLGASVCLRGKYSGIGKVCLPRATEARHVGTDFVWEQPVTVRGERSIDGALRDMMWASMQEVKKSLCEDLR